MAEKLLLPHPFQLFVCHCGKEVLKIICGDILSGLASSQTPMVTSGSNGGGSDHLELINCIRAGSNLRKGQAKKSAYVSQKFLYCIILVDMKNLSQRIRKCL